MHYCLLFRMRYLFVLVLNLLFILTAQAQNVQVRGKVSDASGPLIGVSVKVAGTTAGTLTDENGNYVINAPATGTLNFTYVGYVAQNVRINGRTTINVQLSAQSQALTEVVVTGYSAQRRRDITGSVAVVDVEAATQFPTGSTSQLLQGQASGVTVVSPGAPGAEANVFIRGVTSFGNAQPLIIVDGVQATINDINPNDIASVQVLKDAGAASIYGVRGANGVVVITTKKGRSGAPKVTYEGYIGVQTPPTGNVFDIMSSQEMSSVWRQADPTNILYNFEGNGLPDFFWVNNPAEGVGGYSNAGAPEVDPARYRFDPSNPNNNYQIAAVNKQGTDWFHEVFKDAPQQSHTLSASGGTENSTYLFSVNYLNQEGTLINTYLKRYAARINTTFNIGKRIRIGENAYVFNRSNSGVAGGNQNAEGTIGMVYRISPIIPVRDIQGNFAGTRLGTPLMGNAQNPVAQQEFTSNNRNNSWNIQGNVYGEIDLIKGLNFRTTFGGTVNNQHFTGFNPSPYMNREGYNNANALSENAVYNSNWTWTNTLNYSGIFGKHNVKLLAGTEALNGYGRQLIGGAQGFFLTNIEYLVLSNGTSNITNNSLVTQNTRLFSLFGRADYAFADKYLIGLTIRRDGASVFGADNRYGVFPAVSLGWRINQESFLKDVTWLNDLKIRGSWGKMGSYSNVPNTNAYTLYSQQFGTSYYPIGGTNQTAPGFWLSNIGNAQTGWEEDIVTNVGFDAGFLNNRFTFSAEWYKKQVNGLLFPQPLPATAGAATAPFINIGDVQNTGLDFSLSYNGGKQGSDLTYNISANFTTYKNKIVSLPGSGFFDVSNSRIGNLVRNAEGHPIGSFFGYKVLGLFRDAADVAASPTQSDAAPGRFKYEDVNADGQITAADRTFFGDPNPDFTYGLNLGATYKQFDISTVLYGSQGNKAINYVRYWTDFLGTFTGAKSKALLNAWTPVDRNVDRAQWTATNPNAKTPAAETSSNFSNSGSGSFNSYYMENGSFLKMRSLQIGYTINPKQLGNIQIDRLRIYLQGANLFTITKYTGIDPELTPSTGNLGNGGGTANPPSIGAFGNPNALNNSQASAAFGIDYGNYPNNQRSFLVGINLTF